VMVKKGFAKNLLGENCGVRKIGVRDVRLNKEWYNKSGLRP
jgi:hypothetical protein